jgi:hypothetical protein
MTQAIISKPGEIEFYQVQAPVPAKEQTENLCWTNPLDSLLGKREGTITDPRIMVAILFAAMAASYCFTALKPLGQ